jgi:hypothetical protein
LDLFLSFAIRNQFVPLNYFPNGGIPEIFVFAEMIKKYHIFVNLEFYYRIHLALLLTTKQNHFNMQPISRASILILAYHLGICFPSGLKNSDLQRNIFMYFTYLSACSTYIVLLGVIALIIFAVEYKL